MSSNKSIIIKKVKKSGGGGHHGGAWKVAYADFVTAMMAFFLLMWLLNMSSDEKRVRLSRYFKHFSIFTEGGTSFMGKTSEMFDESGETSSKVFRNPKGRDMVNVEQMQKEIETGISEELGGAADQVIIDGTKDGLRIQIIDKDGSEMFQSGKSTLTPRGKEVLQIVGKRIKGLPNTIAVEGHTDSMPVGKKQYTNWELSAERALTARRELETTGIDSQRVMQVAGFADKSPLIKDDLTDPSNRRISIILHKLPTALAEKGELMPPKYTMDNPAGENISLSDLVERKRIQPPSPAVEKEMTARKSTGSTEKGKNSPVINEEWIPVIDNSKKEPVIEKEWTPVIETDSTASPESDEDSLSVNEEKRENQVVIEKTQTVEPLPYMKFYSPEAAGESPAVIKDFAAPVLGDPPGGIQ